MCAELGAYGGLSLRADAPFGRAAAVEFVVAAPAGAPPGALAALLARLHLRLDATRRPAAATNGTDPGFVTSDLVPLAALVGPHAAAAGNATSSRSSIAPATEEVGVCLALS